LLQSLEPRGERKRTVGEQDGQLQVPNCHGEAINQWSGTCGNERITCLTGQWYVPSSVAGFSMHVGGSTELIDEYSEYLSTFHDIGLSQGILLGPAHVSPEMGLKCRIIIVSFNSGQVRNGTDDIPPTIRFPPYHQVPQHVGDKSSPYKLPLVAGATTNFPSLRVYQAPFRKDTIKDIEVFRDGSLLLIHDGVTRMSEYRC